MNLNRAPFFTHPLGTSDAVMIETTFRQITSLHIAKNSNEGVRSKVEPGKINAKVKFVLFLAITPQCLPQLSLSGILPLDLLLRIFSRSSSSSSSGSSISPSSSLWPFRRPCYCCCLSMLIIFDNLIIPFLDNSSQLAAAPSASLFDGLLALDPILPFPMISFLSSLQRLLLTFRLL